MTQALVTVELGICDPTLSTALSDLAESLDTQYFDARDRGDASWREVFKRARAAAALAAALKTDSGAAAEAIYEAAHAVSDSSSIYNLIVDH